MKVRSSRNNRDGVLVPFETYERLRELDRRVKRSLNMWLLLKYLAGMGADAEESVAGTEQFKALGEAGLATVRDGCIVVSDGSRGKKMKWDGKMNPKIVHKEEVYQLCRHWERLMKRHVGCAPDAWSMQKARPKLDAILSMKREDGSPMFMASDVEEAMEWTLTSRKIAHLNFLQSDMMQRALDRNGNGKRPAAPAAPVAVYNLVGMVAELMAQRRMTLDEIVGQQIYDVAKGGFRPIGAEDVVAIRGAVPDADAVLGTAALAGEAGWEEELRRRGVRYTEDAKSPVR